MRNKPTLLPIESMSVQALRRYDSQMSDDKISECISVLCVTLIWYIAHVLFPIPELCFVLYFLGRNQLKFAVVRCTVVIESKLQFIIYWCGWNIKVQLNNRFHVCDFMGFVRKVIEASVCILTSSTKSKVYNLRYKDTFAHMSELIGLLTNVPHIVLQHACVVAARVYSIFKKI